MQSDREAKRRHCRRCLRTFLFLRARSVPLSLSLSLSFSPDVKNVLNRNISNWINRMTDSLICSVQRRRTREVLRESAREGEKKEVKSILHGHLQCLRVCQCCKTGLAIRIQFTSKWQEGRRWRCTFYCISINQLGFSLFRCSLLFDRLVNDEVYIPFRSHQAVRRRESRQTRAQYVLCDDMSEMIAE